MNATLQHPLSVFFDEGPCQSVGKRFGWACWFSLCKLILCEISCSSEDGPVEVSVEEQGPFEVGPAEDSHAEISIVEVSVAEDGREEINPLEVGLSEVGPKKIGRCEVSPREFGPGEVGPLKLYLDQICAGNIDAGKWFAVPMQKLQSRYFSAVSFNR